MNDVLDITKQMLTHLDVEITSIAVEEIAGSSFVSIVTPVDFSNFQGERLKALNTLVRLIIDKRGLDVRFTIDVNGYYKAEVERLTGMAKMLAERARSLRANVELDPMRPFDRMVVHAALTGEKDVATESAGFGRDRKVVIKYTGAL
jgi:spoIIIJ-associated protein